jgi:hypothetical protein
MLFSLLLVYKLSVFLACSKASKTDVGLAALAPTVFLLAEPPETTDAERFASTLDCSSESFFLASDALE